jgi:pyruvate,water dikinase
LPKGVVDGSVPADVFVVEKGDSPRIRDKDIKPKRRKFVCYEDEGVRRVEVGNEAALPQSLTDEQIVELARAAVHLEQSFGTPQDIEWCVAPDGSILILQSRPLLLWYSAATRQPVSEAEAATWKMLAEGETTAAGGIGSGPVFVLRNEADKLTFPEGAVMVVGNALPAWAPLLGRAAALVAEEGSMAGHLANVAREFRVPALFGVRDATGRLIRGQVVTVDAEARTIYEGRIDSLLQLGKVSKHLMQGSPVLAVLESVAGHIIPLHLLNPDSHDFQPKRCLTYHDITRFAHEVSVREMFHFGEEHFFSERSAKRLVVQVPMQWWVINLDDGFTEPVAGLHGNPLGRAAGGGRGRVHVRTFSFHDEPRARSGRKISVHRAQLLCHIKDFLQSHVEIRIPLLHGRSPCGRAIH